MTYTGKRRSGPWWKNDRDRIVFEGGARKQFGIRGRMTEDGWTYELPVDVPFYETRQVRIHFSPWGGRIPTVTVDGPTSPHRFDDGSLCMWFPYDPPRGCWVFEDGLLALLGHIMAHLFREAWFRDYGYWPGPEVPHGGPKENVEEDEE